MIFVIGGTCQGKREFAEHRLLPEAGGPRSAGVLWTDGAEAGWDQFMRSGYCVNFHLFIRRILKGEVVFEGMGNPDGNERGAIWQERDNAGGETLVPGLTRALMRENPDRILVTDEIGYGIVPVDAFERRYREETGRICCQAAREAAEVWRVCCGMGQRIK